MRILFEYTKRILMKNRARTLVTIAGIVLSFALFTAVLTGGASGIQYLIDVAKIQHGDWHGVLYNTDADVRAKLEQMEGVTNIFSMQDLGVACIPEDTNEARPYVSIGGVDEAFLSHMSICLVDGRMPEKEGEVIVPSNLYKTNVRITTGDTITLEIGTRQALDGTPIYHSEPYRLQQETFVGSNTKTYTVVGIYETKYLSNACKQFYTVKQENQTIAEDLFFGTTQLENLKEWILEYFPENLSTTNTYVLLYSGYGEGEYTGRVYEMIQGFIIILCLLVSFISVSLIYNSFAISLGERTKQFGLLKSIGTTKSQIRWIVWMEASILCLIAIPIGLLLGCGSVCIVLNILQEHFLILSSDANAQAEIVFHSEPIYLFTAVFMGVVTVMISALIPAIRANAMTPVNAIRQSNDIKISARSVRGGKLWKLLFGVPGMLAYKSAKRNKKPYRGIIFSVASSLILFLAGGGLAVYMTFFANYELQSIDYDYQIYYPGILSNEEEETVTTYLEEQESIEDFVITRSQQIMLDFSEVDAFTEVGEIYLKRQLKNKTYMPINVCYIDNHSYLKLLEQNRLDRALYYDAEQPMAIAINYLQGTSWRDNGESYNYAGPLYKNSSVLSKLSLWTIKNIGGYVSWYGTPTGFGFYTPDMETKEHSIEEVRQDIDILIGAMLSKEAMPSFIDTYIPTILLPMKAVQDAGMLKSYQSMLFVYATDEKQAWQDLVEMQRDKTFPVYLGMNNITQQSKMSKAMFTIINVFMNCFVTVLCIIAIGNIVNTISTSVRMRTREYAMLKSIGMGTKAMNRYVLFENLSYTVKAGIIGFLISIGINYVTLNMMQNTLTVPFFLPTTYYIIALIALVLLVCFSVTYTHYKTKGTHICDELRNEVW